MTCAHLASRPFAGVGTRSSLVTDFFDALAKRLRENACGDGMLTSGILDKHQSLIDGLFEVAKHELFLFDLAFESQRTLESDTEIREIGRASCRERVCSTV